MSATQDFKNDRIYYLSRSDGHPLKSATLKRKVMKPLKSAGRLKCEITVPLIVFCRTTADNTSNIVSLTLFFSVQPVYVLPTQNKKMKMSRLTNSNNN